MNTNIDKRRSEWLKVIKQITERCFERESRLSDLCPQRYAPLDKEAKTVALKEIAGLSRDISADVERLNQVEQGGGIGFSVVLGSPPDGLVAVAMALLVSARLDCAAGHQIRNIQDVVNFTAVRSPTICDQVRSLFRSDSILYHLVGMGRGVALDMCTCTLRESVLNRILARPSDETEMRCEAEYLLGGSKVRG